MPLESLRLPTRASKCQALRVYCWEYRTLHPDRGNFFVKIQLDKINEKSCHFRYLLIGWFLKQSSRIKCRFLSTFLTSTECSKSSRMWLGSCSVFWACTGLASKLGSISIELFGLTIASGLFDLWTGAGATWISTGMSFSFLCFILLIKSALTSLARGFDGANGNHNLPKFSG